MTSAREVLFEQIRNWVKAESSKGRPMKEIVAELATRKDVTLLSVHDSPEVTHQRIVSTLKNVG